MSCLTWVLETELWPPEIATTALNHRAIYPVPFPLFLKLFVHVCVQVWAHAPWCACEDQKMACWSQFSPSTTSLGLKLKASGLYQPTETSHQPLKHFLKGLQITKQPDVVAQVFRVSTRIVEAGGSP